MKRIETNIFEQVEDRPGMVRIVGRKKAVDVFAELESALNIFCWTINLKTRTVLCPNLGMSYVMQAGVEVKAYILMYICAVTTM